MLSRFLRNSTTVAINIGTSTANLMAASDPLAQLLQQEHHAEGEIEEPSINVEDCMWAILNSSSIERFWV
jgi:hypothetical protein